MGPLSQRHLAHHRGISIQPSVHCSENSLTNRVQGCGASHQAEQLEEKGVGDVRIVRKRIVIIWVC